MKEYFYNKIGYNTARVRLLTNAGELNLYYQLHDNPVQHVWQDIQLSPGELHTPFPTSIPIDDAINKLKEACRVVNEPEPPEVITQKYLNELHRRFVEEGESDEWQNINLLIHLIEGKLSNSLSDFTSTFHFFKKPDTFVELKEEYKLFLNTQIKWGQLTLGYGTLGKDWWDLFKNNDLDADFSLQKTISSETCAYFGMDQPVYCHRVIDFYNWASTTNIDVPLDNLNLLSLGRYMLGEIIITEDFLEYHPIASDWYVPNHSCKLSWNRDILDQGVRVKEVEFFNSDLYFETLYKHTNFQTLQND
jgi:hypothetical protein